MDSVGKSFGNTLRNTTCEGGRATGLVRERERDSSVVQLPQRPQQTPPGALELGRPFSDIPVSGKGQGRQAFVPY